MALAMMPHYGGKLGDTLVGLGLLKPLEVFRHLTRQVRTKLIDVCSWTKGSFAWYSGRENPREAFPLDLNTYEVLGAGAMALPNDTIELWLEENRMRKLKANRSRRIGPDRFEVKALVELYDRLDGKRSIGQLCEIAGGDKLRVARMLYLLECCDLAKE
jgi:serine/threonine-protein kinase